MVDILDNMLKDAERLLVAVVAVMAVWFVVWTWIRTRSVVPVIGAVLVGAAVLWGVRNMQFLRERVNEDVNAYENNNGPQIDDSRGNR
jgi:fatty acid desaturase